MVLVKLCVCTDRWGSINFIMGTGSPNISDLDYSPFRQLLLTTRPGIRLIVKNTNWRPVFQTSAACQVVFQASYGNVNVFYHWNWYWTRNWENFHWQIFGGFTISSHTMPHKHFGGKGRYWLNSLLGSYWLHLYWLHFSSILITFCIYIDYIFA